MSTNSPQQRHVLFSTRKSGPAHRNLAFARIPQQSRLFLDYLADPTALRRYYPNATRFHHELATRAPEVLAAHGTDRNVLCDALAEMNTRWGAGAETLRNIARLRSPESIAVVSGQQVGLFTARSIRSIKRSSGKLRAA